MKRIILFISMIYLCKSGSTQLFADMHFGYNYMHITTESLTPDGDYSYSLGLDIGKLTDSKFIYKAGLLYERRKYTYDIILTDATGDTIDLYTSEFLYQYLGLPLQAGYNSGLNFYWYGTAGLIPALLIRATSTVPVFGVNSELIGDSTIVFTNDLTKFNLSAVATLGGGYNFGRFGSSVFLQYQYSLTPIQKDSLWKNFYGWTVGAELRWYLTEE